MKIIRASLLVVMATVLSGCNLTLLNPAGDVAQQQGDLIIYATVLMLIVILPVMALTVFFALRYRASNEAEHDPEWDHSVSLEIVIWAVPLAIIVCLAGLTWVATHRLDPYQDLRRISEEQPIDPDVAPMVVYVVAMDWKWMFIYPEENIATVNEMAVIVDRPVEFKLTSATVMNAFYIPEMAGMIYAMAGMETELNAVLNAPGIYEGFSANYSGIGFSYMDFDVHAGDAAAFDAWVEEVRAGGRILDQDRYRAIEVTSTNHSVEYFAEVEDGLWDRILNMCVGDDRLCLNDMMMVDALGGGGIAGLYNRELYRGLCTADDPEGLFAILRPDLIDRQDEITQAMRLDRDNLLPTTAEVN